MIIYVLIIYYIKILQKMLLKTAKNCKFAYYYVLLIDGCIRPCFDKSTVPSILAEQSIGLPVVAMSYVQMLLN